MYGAALVGGIRRGFVLAGRSLAVSVSRSGLPRPSPTPLGSSIHRVSSPGSADASFSVCFHVLIPLCACIHWVSSSSDKDTGHIRLDPILMAVSRPHLQILRTLGVGIDPYQFWRGTIQSKTCLTSIWGNLKSSLEEGPRTVLQLLCKAAFSSPFLPSLLSFRRSP